MSNTQRSRSLEHIGAASISVERSEQERAGQRTASTPGETALTGNPEAQSEVNVRRNEELTGQIRQEGSPVRATGTANGVPVQEESPAGTTFKERQQERRKARAAGRANSVATAASYDMVAALKEGRMKKENSLGAHRALIEKSGVNGNILLYFSKGYQEKGILSRRPATAQDAANRADDEQFIKDYCSKDLQRRKPHLERMVNEVLDLKLTRDMFTERNLRRNIRQLEDIMGKTAYLMTAMGDPVNAPFFKNLDPYRRAALEEKVNISSGFNVAMTMSMYKYGVNINNCDYMADGNDSRQLAALGTAQMDSARSEFEASLNGFNQRMEALKAEQKQRVLKSATSYAARMDAGEELLERLKPQLGLQNGEETGSLISRAHVFFRMEEGAEEQNLATARTLLEADRLKEGEKPSMDLYRRVRDLAALRVERIMDCDVDELAGLTDEALMVRSEELNGFVMDSVALDDLMKIRHPTVTNGGENGKAPTLRDELVEYRSEEFSYKVNMLRGLHERARALAIRRALVEEDAPWTSMLTKEERSGIEEKQQLGDRTQSLLNEGNETVKTAHERRNAVGLKALGVDAYQEMVERNRAKALFSLKLSEEGNILRSGLNNLEKDVLKRVKEDEYYSLAYSQAEMQEMGLTHLTIGEALMRNFESFMGQEATQKLLTPDTAREMVRNLGAGAGMHKGKWTTYEFVGKESVKVTKEGTPEEELKDPVEKNKQGLAVHKEIYRAQFDMLSRKYGNMISEASVEEMMDHQRQIKSDFRQSQTALNIATKFPGYFNPSSEEDMLLKNRMIYFGFIGPAMDGFASNFAANFTFDSEQEMRDKAKEYFNTYLTSDSSAREAYEWLCANDREFTHRVDWSQKVRVPGENAAPRN